MYCAVCVVSRHSQKKEKNTESSQALKLAVLPQNAASFPARDRYERPNCRYQALSVSGVRKAVASVLPWKVDEGIRTLLSLNLASQCCLPLPVTDSLDRAPGYLISGSLLPPEFPGNSTIPWSLAGWVLSACPHVEFSCFV